MYVGLQTPRCPSQLPFSRTSHPLLCRRCARGERRVLLLINQYEFSGFENSLWALLPEAVPDRNLWKQVHVSVELDNVTSIKYGWVAVSRSIRMSRKGASFLVEAVGLSLSFRHLAGERNVEADRLSR